MKKLKIGLFMDDFYPSMNGVIEVMVNHASGLIKKGHDVVVVVPNLDKKHKDNYPFKVIRVKSVKFGNIGYNMALPTLDIKMEKKLLDEKFDIIHIHSPFIMGKLGVKIGEKLNIPIVATMHTQFDKDIKKITKSDIITKIVLKDIVSIFNRCDQCFAVNEDTAKLFKKYGCEELPAIQITGTDLKLSENKIKDNEIVNKKYGLKKTDLVFSFVGRLTVLKNIPFILDSLKVLKDSGIEFKMLFVGPFEDKEEILAKIREHKLYKNVVFTGKVMDRELLTKIYGRSKLFLFPSLYDTNSLVQKEAASQKVPTVFLKGAVTANLITDNVNGILSLNDPNSYALKIKEILDDEKLYNKVSEGCYKDIYINWDMLVDSLIKEYYKIIKNKVAI